MLYLKLKSIVQYNTLMSEIVRKATDTMPLPTFWAQAQLHLCVLGINLQGNEKNVKMNVIITLINN